MSLESVQKRLNVERIAVIGAGPSGLAVTKYLLAEKRFSKIQVFEQRATSGGVWNHEVARGEHEPTRPRTEPSNLPDQAIHVNDDAQVHFASPVYDLLETNIPHTLMNYTDLDFPKDSALFPRHEVVLRYLQDYAKEVEPYVFFRRQVLSVNKMEKLGKPCWQVQVRDLKTGEITKSEFDAVVVASGHYSDEFVPDIPGLVEFEEKHPTAIIHSKYYRKPDSYAGKKVIVVGSSASGIDISAQISSFASLPVLISEKITYSVVEGNAWSEHVPEIVELIPSGKAVRFSNGRIEENVDAVVFCTGYHYSFPFLRNLDPPVAVLDGSHAAGLWEHMVYTADPTLAFLCIPQRIVPFPVAEAQSAVLARIWAGRLDVPPRREMEAWVERLVAERGETKAMHNMAFPRDVEYINRFHDLSKTARKVEDLDLERDGEGKRPPFWGDEKAWTRQRIPQIKVASRALGSRRHQVKSLDDLGFSYDEWKRLMGGLE